MAPKHKPPADPEDISQLRKPITIHGKPVEQILNSIHYGSPELRSLLLHECDIIFECKVCRALFRDLPNFIAHKRRYCSKSAADTNHLRVAELPNEKVIMVQPRAPSETKTRATRNHRVNSSSSNASSEDASQHSGETERSLAFQVYSNAAEKLQHQKDNTNITSIRTTDIPGNSNAVFVDVSTVSVNIHERHPSGRGDGVHKTKPPLKIVSRRAGENEVSGKKEKLNLRSNASGKSKELTDMLMRELKVMQNRVRNKATGQKGEKDESMEGIKDKVTAGASCSGQQKKPGEKSTSKVSKEKNMECPKMPQDTAVNLSPDSDSLDRYVLIGNEMSLAENNGDCSTVPNDANGKDKKDPKSKSSLICAKCQCIFTRRSALWYHNKVHHAEKKTFYPCIYCSSVYSYFGAVVRHLGINHGMSKLEIAPIREELRSKAYSKKVSSQAQSQESGKSAQRNQGALRRGLRGTGQALNTKFNNTSYVCSLVKKRKNVPVKRSAQAINEEEQKFDKSEEEKFSIVEGISKSNPSVKTERETNTLFCDTSSLTSKKVVTPTRSQTKANDLVKGESSTAKNVSASNNSLPRPPSSIDSAMQTCSKCSRLFGSRAVYDKHVKVCHDQSLDIKKESPKKAALVSSSAADDSNSTTVSTGSIISKSKEVSDVPLSCVTANRKLRRFNDSCLKESVVSFSNAVQQVKDTKFDGFVTNGGCRKQDKDKIVIDSDSESSVSFPEVCDNVDKPSANDLLTQSTQFDSDVLSDALSLSKEIKDKVEAETNQSKLTRLKSKAMSEESSSITDSEAEPPQTRGEKAATQVSGKDLPIDKSTVLSQDDSSESERPRRKRKVPSRNIGAVELLKKIHRVEKEEPYTKRTRSSSPLATSDSTQGAASVRHQSGKVRDRKKITLGKLKGDNNCNPTRNRVVANKVFVFNPVAGRNRSKLQCYDHKKVEKLIDHKTLSCLKCGMQVSHYHNLKRHIVRKHLQWSRFQCKLCSFNSFDRSECNTHIKRTHYQHKARHNQLFNHLIIDLAKKGTKAMALKKHQTLKAKSEEQENINIYKNQNTQKVPRLFERAKKSDIPSSATPADDSKKQNRSLRTDRKRDVPEEGVQADISVNEGIVDAVIDKNGHLPNGDASLSKNSSPVKDAVLPLQRPHKITHLVCRTQAGSKSSLSSSSSSDTVTENYVSIDKQTSSPSKVEMSNCLPATTVVSVNRKVLPFNISTRNSPRVFDTTPYSREDGSGSDEPPFVYGQQADPETGLKDIPKNLIPRDNDADARIKKIGDSLTVTGLQEKSEIELLSAAGSSSKSIDNLEVSPNRAGEPFISQNTSASS